MIWHLKDNGVRRPKDLPDHIERRLCFALSRFGSRIGKVFVFLHDMNGPKGGIDKVCRILVKTEGFGIVVVAVADTEWVAAVDRATTRVGHSVARQLAKWRERHAARSARKPVERLWARGRA